MVKKRTAFGYLCLVYTVIEVIRSVLLWPADADYMAGLIVEWRSLSIPAEVLRWIVFTAVYFLGCALIASSMGAWLERWRSRRKSRREIAVLVKKLLPHAKYDQRALLERLLFQGPQWLKDIPQWRLAQSALEVIEKREVKVGYGYSGYSSTATEHLTRVNPGFRRPLSWRLRVWRWRVSRAERRRLKSNVLSLDREERTFLWLFWQANEAEAKKAVATMTSARRTLANKDIIEVKNDYSNARKPRSVELQEAAKRLVENHVLGGKKVARTEIYF